jgi:dTDP-glucose 4,6-dehydratase
LKILVTGGLGFIGSNFCRYTLTKHPDYEIINIDKIGIGANPTNLKDLENEKRYKFIKGNICDSNVLNKLIKKVNAIVNIAAETHVDRSLANPPVFIENNTVGTFTILEAIRKYNNKAKLIHVSTDEIYGEIKEGSFKEHDRPNPSNPYSASKAAADMLVLAYHRTYGLHTIISRCTNNFGPYQFPEKLIPKTIIRASLNLKVPIYGLGRNVRDWIHVLDHCEALDMLLKDGKEGEIYNISSGNEYENIEVVKRILKIMDKDESLIEFVEDRPGHDVRYSLDSSKIRSELGWKPKYNFKDALKETVKWYLKNEYWWKPLATEQVLHSTPWKLKW